MTGFSARTTTIGDGIESFLKVSSGNGNFLLGPPYSKFTALGSLSEPLIGAQVSP